MTQSITLRAALAFLIFVLGSLQAWDSNVPEAGFFSSSFQLPQD